MYIQLSITLLRYTCNHQCTCTCTCTLNKLLKSFSLKLYFLFTSLSSTDISSNALIICCLFLSLLRPFLPMATPTLDSLNISSVKLRAPSLLPSFSPSPFPPVSISAAIITSVSSSSLASTAPPLSLTPPTSSSRVGRLFIVPWVIPSRSFWSLLCICSMCR